MSQKIQILVILEIYEILLPQELLVLQYLIQA